MKEIGKYATGAIIGLLIVIGFYFLEYKPSLKKAEEEGYKAGIAECNGAIPDTAYLPGKPTIVYRDTSFKKDKPIIEIENKVLGSIFDTSYVSGKDTISVEAKTIFDIKANNADWAMNIKHKDYELNADTIKIYIPEIIEKTIIENNWLNNLIAYGAGILTAIAIWVITLL